MKHKLTQSEIECLRTISRLADELNVPILVVGASARQLVFNLAHGIEAYRSTQDWDFGVRVPDWEAFRRFRGALLNTTAFEIDHLREQRLLCRATGMKVDLVPFGGLEANGRIRWPESQSEMDVTGFSDAYHHCIDVEVDGGLRLRVATTPLLAALKLFAFADRKNETDRDITDLWHVMGKYLESGQLLRWSEEPIVSNIPDGFEWECAGAFVLGYDMANACSPKTVERLLPVVAILLDPYSRYTGPLVGYCESQEQEETRRRHISKSFQWLLNGIQLAVRLRSH